MSILKIENLNYEYEKDKKVLNNVNIEFEEGQIYSIIGKSGSGKTTLISLISGLEKNKDGKIYYENKDISKYNIDLYRSTKVSIIFQQYNLLNTYTVLDNILIAMNIAKQKPDEKIAYELLEKVNLSHELANKKPLELSGGQQQRVAIARALAKNAKIIIADEPTGNLDENTEKDILNLLTSICKKENKTLIMVTHSNFVANSSDHVYGITNGNVNYIK